jgi:hypothetical protein
MVREERRAGIEAFFKRVRDLILLLSVVGLDCGCAKTQIASINTSAGKNTRVASVVFIFSFVWELRLRDRFKIRRGVE